MLNKVIGAVGAFVGFCARHARSTLTTAVEVVGAGLIVKGAAMIYTPAGWLVAGAFLVILGYLEGDR